MVLAITMEITKQNVLECIIKKPVLLKAGDVASDFKSGVSVTDIVFPGSRSVEVPVPELK